MQMGWTGLAACLLQQTVQLCPTSAHAWNNLGICFKREHMNELADLAFEKAFRFEKHPDFPSNQAAIYINNGTPERALELSERALALEPDHAQSLWHKGLALLEMQRWPEAWDAHEYRLHPASNCGVGERNYARGDGEMTPWWDGESKGKVVIHGEQGLGDEILFASCLADAVATGAEIVFEPTVRLAGLMARSFPEIEVHGTDRHDGSEWMKEGQTVDYKCALGSLPKFWRRSEGAFPGKPYLIVDETKKRHWFFRLKKLGRKPKIGVAWQGGAQKTRIDLRSLPLEALIPIFRDDVDWISLQYTEAAKNEVRALEKERGVKVHHYGKDGPESPDMDDLAALVANLDLVVSVCQTSIHMAGGLGVPCWCLTPSAPAWRYGVTGNMPWYRAVDLIRQRGDDWGPVLDEVKSRLDEWLVERKVA
jgi:tetratricopeptide (TPR) repeat protein